MKKIYLLAICFLVSSSLFIPSSVSAKEDKPTVDIRGTYGMSAGFTTDKFIWKDANGNYQEKNFRYIDEFDSVNTYDKRVFDRYELQIQTDTRTPLNLYSQIVMDPWTFVGKKHQVVRNISVQRRATVDVEYKFLGSTGKVINESYRATNRDNITYPELKVIGGQVSPYTFASRIDGFSTDGFALADTFNLSAGRTVKMDYFARPIRKLWVDYNEEPVYVKVFPIADQAEALTSDDPIGLSNHHIYWAPSPWLYDYQFGQVFNDGVVLQSRWSEKLPFFAQDTNRNFLTFLRGATVQYNLPNTAEFRVTGATPMSLWDYYEEADSVPIAARLKLHPTQKLDIGATYTIKTGIADKDIKATNNAFGIDAAYEVKDDTKVFGEFAYSYSDYEYANMMRQGYRGIAYKTGINSKYDIDTKNKVWGDLTFTSMSKKFEPGLSDYRDTRLDREWGRHIWFETIPAEDEAWRIGDSIDTNRYVIGANLRAKMCGNLFELYFNFRNAHNYYDNKFIENVMRVEATCNPVKNFQIKGLALYRMYPRTVGDSDPFLKDRFTDEPLKNYAIDDGMNCDLMTFSGGAKWDIFDRKVSIYAIYEATNDPQDFPRNALTSNNFVTNALADDTDGWLSNSNLVFDRLIDQVYSQQLFDLPPYGLYSIIKGKITYAPYNNFMISYTHVTNQNRNYAALLDDNHNHDGIDVLYKPIDRLIFRLGYSLSRIINLRRAIDTNGGDRPFEFHSNIYAQAEWDVDKAKTQKLTVQFGEYGLLQSTLGVFGGGDNGEKYLPSRASVLDTRSILRLFYQGKF